MTDWCLTLVRCCGWRRGNQVSPADRFIIATAIKYSLTVVTGDRQFALYNIPVIC